MGYNPEEAYNIVQNEPHKAKLSHELIAAAASYEAVKAWNDHQERHGKEVNHKKAKEIMAGAAGFFIDRLIETKGLDALDRHKLKADADKHHDDHLQKGW